MILLVLIALVARVDAAPRGASVDRAIRSADAWTSAGYAGPHEEDDEDGDEETEDRAAERAEINDREEDEDEIADQVRSAESELAALLGAIARAAEPLRGERRDATDLAHLGLGSDDASALKSLAFDAARAGSNLGLEGDANSALASLGLEAAGDATPRLGIGGDASDAAMSLGLDGDASGAAASLGFDGDASSALASLGLEDADGAAASLALGDDGELGWSAGAGALAMLDAELAPGDTTAGLDAADAGATAGAQEAYEAWMRHRRPSPWGRLDVGVSWRHHWREPIHAPAYSHDEIWLVATWRR